jgi:small-conductance mechanosensitive channel
MGLSRRGLILPLLQISSLRILRTDNPVSEPGSEPFYSGALERIRRFMMVIGAAATVAAWIRFGGRVALGMACGCAVAHLNFYWLKRGVSGLADRITHSSVAKSGKGIVLRFLLRYVLMAVAAYAILSVSPASLYGFFAGLFLPVAAVACEAAYETYVALVRGT